MEGTKTSERLHSLTSLRFFAAAWVLCFHVVPKWVAPFLNSLPILKKVINCGYVSVAFFYVLSGFVLCHTYGEEVASGHFSAVRFLRRRFARLAPVFYLSLLLGAPLFLAELLKAHPGASALALFGTYLTENVFFFGAWWPPGLGFNFPGWSISVEMAFYLSFPWLIRAAFKQCRATLAVGLGICFLMGAGLQAVGHIIFPDLLKWVGDQPGQPEFQGGSQIAAAFLHTNPIAHLPEFVFGILLCRLRQFKKLNDPISGDAMLFVALVALGSAIHFSDQLPHLFLNSSALLPVIGLAIWGASSHRSFGFRWFESRPIVFLGEASYALYILHVPVRDWFSVIMSRLSWGPPGIAATVVYCATMLIASSALFVLVEKPAQKWINERFEY